jgi:hypothetical protein
MRASQNFTMGDTGIPIDGNVKIDALNSENLGDALNVNGAAVAGETNVFTLSDIFITITRYQFYEPTYYNIINKVFSEGRVFNIHFKNYDMYTGPSTRSRTNETTSKR